MKPILFILLTLVALLIFLILFLPGFPFMTQVKRFDPGIQSDLR